MFRSQKDSRTFIAIVMTYMLDLVGFSIVFPVLAPLLLNTDLHYFASDTPVSERTIVLGILFSVFGLAQFLAGAVIGGLADHYGRYKVLLGTIGLGLFGYLIMSFSVFSQSLSWMFVGRIVTGFCSGNAALAQAVTADLTDLKHRGKAFGILAGVGGLGFVAGPWVGGKLANPNWLYGSGAFLFAAVASALNLLVVLFFFTETWKPKAAHIGKNFLATFKDIRLVFHNKKLKNILATSLIFSLGWSSFLMFFPTFLVQRFSLRADKIGDIFAYMAVIWFFVSMVLNKELSGRVSLKKLISIGLLFSSVGVALCLAPHTLWPYWIIIFICMIGGALSWINFGTLLSTIAEEHMQGRVLGVNGSAWSMGQIVAPLAAGILAGWNIYSPLLLGSTLIFLSFLYFIFRFKEKKA